MRAWFSKFGESHPTFSKLRSKDKLTDRMVLSEAQFNWRFLLRTLLTKAVYIRNCLIKRG